MVDSGVSASHVSLSRSFTVSSLPLLAFLLVASMLFGVTATWVVTRDRGVELVRGTITGTNDRVSVIGFRADGRDNPRDGVSVLNGGEIMRLLADVSWTDTSGTIHDGRPIGCVPPGTQGQRVELGLVEYHPGAGSRTSKVVVSVRCLDH
ncbi:MAG: hypothetical protein ACRDTM_10535 [Micromonosporaceae bacterium]